MNLEDPVIPTLSRVKEAFRYDTESGKLFWRISRPGISPGDEAGTDNNGYLRLSIDGTRYLVHVIVWYLNTGEYPAGVVDHKDGNPTNNRLENLRSTTRKVNAQNRQSKSSNEAGLLGVTCKTNTSGIVKYRASIRIEGKLHALGTFDTAEEAHNVYCVEKAKYHEGSTLTPSDLSKGKKLKISGTGEKLIYNNRSGFQVKTKEGSFGTYSTLEKAIEVRNKILNKETV